MDALNSAQADRFEDIYKHRYDLTQELATYLVDPDYNLFLEALKTLRALARFRTEVEAGYGTFEDFRDVDLDQITNGRVLLIDLAISAFRVGLTNADEYGGFTAR